jgi:hypothetical protein
MEFWEYLDKVGMMHVGQGRVHPLHVEYVHIGVTLSFVQDILTEAVLSHPKLKMDRKIALVKALSKVIWIQNDLFAKWYVRDGDEFQEDRLVPEVEAEGYLHGKKVVHDGSESDSELEDAAGGSCPFKHLATSSSPSGDKGLRNGMEKMSLNGASTDRETGSSIAGAPLPTSPTTTLANSAIPRAVGSSAL